MNKKSKLITGLLSILLLSACDYISTPDDYFKGVLADASGCSEKNITIVKETYDPPSTIWTISCDGSTFDCYEQSTGFRQVSGFVSRAMFCNKIIK